MRILYIAHSSALEGAGFALINILKEVKRHNITPFVLLPSEGKMTEVLDDIGVEYFITKYENFIYPKVKHSFKGYIFFILRLIKIFLHVYNAKKKCNQIVISRNIDIIHTNTSVIHFGAEVAKKNKIPHIWHIREFQDMGLGFTPIWNMTNLKQKLSKQNNHCIAITKAVYQYYNLTDIKDIQIYDGVFSNLYPMKINILKKNYLLFVGNLTIKKGILDAIDAFNQIGEELKEIELWIAGNDTINLIEIIQKSPYKDRIKFLGFRNDIYKLMSEAKALLIPSYYEGFGFIMVEGMLNGCLVIGRDLAGLKEQFDNGLQNKGIEIGLRFKTQDEFIDQIKRVCNSHINDFINTIKNSQDVILNYTIEKSTSEIVNFYNKVLKQ